MNRATVTVERSGRDARVVREETLDPFSELCSGSGPWATVAMTVGGWHLDGGLKVTAHVTLSCEQTEAALDRAHAMALRKAVEFMNDGFARLQRTESR